MREVVALLRATWVAESSYRVNMMFSLGSLLFMVVPLYFVASALQPVMASTIATQSHQYFAFALLGTTIYVFVAACTSALPTALASAIGRGTLEAYLSTPAHPVLVFAGIGAYGVCWASLRAGVMLAAGIALGVHLSWLGVPSVLLVVALLVLAYGAVGLLGGAMLLYFRTTGPLLNGVLTISSLLGGVYYPTHVIPSWLQQLSKLLPLTYGLRAARQAALLGAPLRVIAPDVLVLALFAVGLFSAGALSLGLALRHARRTGSLGHY